MASQGSFSKYRLKNGQTRWQVQFWDKDYTGKNQKIHKAGFATRTEAKAWYDKYVSAGNRNPNMTFGDLYQYYMKDVEMRLKPTTISHKRWTIETHILPFFKDTKLVNITPHAIIEWQNDLMNATNPKTSNGYTPTYLYSIHEQMSAIMNYAVKFFGLAQNPCKIAGSMGSSHADEMNYWTLDQFNAFLDNEPKRIYRIVFEIFFWTGIRLSELCALTPADIPENENVIHITKNYVVVNGKGIIQPPKTKKSIRDIDIPQQLHDEIWEYIHSVYIGENERLCLYSKTALDNELKRIAKKADLPEIHVHELRHSHASFLIHNGVDILTVSNRLGHERTSTTMNIYGHMYKEENKKVVQLLSGAMENTESNQ